MITVLQRPLNLIVQGNADQVVVDQDINAISVIQERLDQIIVQQIPFPQITVIGTLAMGNIIPFSFTASTNGQTIFGPLPGIPSAVVCLFVMGTGQDQIVGDFSISGLNVVLGVTAPYINEGDLVFGSIQI